MTTIKKHYDQIDALKGVATALVILGHSIIVYPVNLHENEICLFLFDLISSVHMPLFFMISGYNFHYKEGNFISYLAKKAKRLLMPYFVFNIFDIILKSLLPSLVNKKVSISSSITDILLHGGNYWFNYVLFVILLIFPIISKYKNNNKVMISVLLISLIAKIFGFGTTNFCFNLVSIYLFYFVIGVIIKTKINIFESQEIKNMAKKSLILILMIWLLLFYINRKLNNVLLSVVISIFGIIFIYCASCFDKVTNIFKKFGANSLSLYLISGYALVASRTVICAFTNCAALIIVFNFLIDFCLTNFIIDKIKKIKFIAFLLGE